MIFLPLDYLRYILNGYILIYPSTWAKPLGIYIYLGIEPNVLPHKPTELAGPDVDVGSLVLVMTAKQREINAKISFTYHFWHPSNIPAF